MSRRPSIGRISSIAADRSPIASETTNEEKIQALDGEDSDNG